MYSRTCCFGCKYEEGPKSIQPLLVVGGKSGIIKVVNIVTGYLEHVLIGHGGAITELHQHPLDQGLIFSASYDNSIRLWNVITGVCVAMFFGEQGHQAKVKDVPFTLYHHHLPYMPPPPQCLNHHHLSFHHTIINTITNTITNYYYQNL